jgi:uncharacterized protein
MCKKIILRGQKMIFIIDDWMNEIVSKIKNAFGAKVTFVDLQGSYKRQEANDSSDIDVVVILNEVTMQDFKKYRTIISQMPYKEKACGFISGQREIIGWKKSDLFQFYYDTQPIYGNIDYLLPLIDREDITRAIKIGACNNISDGVVKMIRYGMLKRIFAKRRKNKVHLGGLINAYKNSTSW